MATAFVPFAPPGPEDQAHGLRRLFAARRGHVLALVANPHVAFAGVVLDRVAALLAAQGRKVLVVDAASTSPPAHELASVDLAAGIEAVAPNVAYLPGRGLPRAHVDTRGSAAGLLDALQAAAPEFDVVVLHADGADLARVFRLRPVRAVLLGADHPESVKHAYAMAKLMVQRCASPTFDLLLVAQAASPRAVAIAESVSGCIDRFLAATLLHCALVDPAADPTAPPDDAIAALLASQLALDGDDTAAPRAAPSRSSPAARAAANPL